MDFYNNELSQKITLWLNGHLPDKERLVRMLIDRLSWKSLDTLCQGRNLTALEEQICRTDICHFAFPDNLNILLQSIGKMEPVEKFEGCGTYNPEIREFLKQEFLKLCDSINLNKLPNRIDEKNTQLKLWLNACLAKTIKEQTGINEQIPFFNKE